jgi:uncharacterized protein (DUF1015 family)
MHISPFQALYPNPHQLGEASDLFDTARESYPTLAQSGIFHSTLRPALFLYEIQTLQRTYRGLLAGVAIRDYLEGNIKKHEATMPEEEHKQMLLTLERDAAVKPILLIYPDAPRIDRWMESYMQKQAVFLEVAFAKETQIHRLWQVETEGDMEALQTLFLSDVPHAYIADGHHRMAAMGLIAQSENAAIRQRFQSVYCAFFPSIEVDILEFNRVVEVPIDFHVQQLENLFEIKPLAAAAKPTKLHEMTLCTTQGWFQLNWKAKVLAEFADDPVVLDTLLLNEKVLKEMLGIADIRHDRRVEYVDAKKGLETIQHKVLEGATHIGFCLYPVAFDDLMTLVEANQTLPPKSTWFEPRMKNGLIVKPY